MTGQSANRPTEPEPKCSEAGNRDGEDIGVNFKRFLQQREVLDSLRTYLDPTETTINRLLRSGIISTPQRDELLTLRWPRNRSELMQILVRRPWAADRFMAFMEVVKHTQNPRLSQDMKRLLKKENVKIAEEEKEDEPFEHPLKDIIMSGMTTSDAQRLKNALCLDGATRNIIQGIIQERDEALARTRADLEASRKLIKDLETANGFLQGQMAYLEAVVADVVSQVVADGIYPNSEDGLRAVLLEVQKLWSLTKADQATIVVLEEENMRKTLGSSFLTTQNIELKEVKSKLQKKITALEAKTAEEIAALRASLKSERESAYSLCNQLTEAKADVQATEMQLSDTTEKLQATECALGEVRQTRDSLLTELKAVDYRVRKLLKSMGMPADRRMLSQSIEHAGNLMMVRRRLGDKPNTTRGQPEQEKAEPVLKDEADGSSARDSLGAVDLGANRRLSTQELSLELPVMTRRRTSLLGLPRMAAPTTTTLGSRPMEAALGNPPSQLSRQNSLQHITNGPLVRQNSQVALPHIRRRSSLAWKLKADMTVGADVRTAGLEEVGTADALRAARRRSMYFPSVDNSHALT